MHCIAKTKLCFIGLLCWITVSAGCGDPLDKIGEKQYNILLITIDTLRADRLGVYGYTEIKTPNIDRLADEGIRFKRAFTPCPVTLPSHVSIMTGTYPLYHGVRNNGIFHARESLTTLAEVLKSRGYRTGAVIGAYVLDSAYGLSQGFDHYDDAIDQEAQSEQITSYHERKAEEVTQRSYSFLKQNNDKPFFLWVHYFDPHWTYDPPQPFATQYPESAYNGEVAYVDAEIGRLLQMLRATGAYDDTLLVVTSDHGEGLMEHNEESHGVLLYDTTLHVPLIFYNQELIPGSIEIDSQVSLLDIMPTILDFLNISPARTAPSIQGASLLPLIKGGKDQIHEELYFETLLPYFDYGWAGLRGFRNKEFKYIAGSQPELYNTIQDPAETTNLHDETDQKGRGLKEVLLETASRYGFQGEETDGRGIEKEAQDKLSALGYSSGALHTRIEGDPFQGPDPKANIWVQSALGRIDLLFQQGRYSEALDKLTALQTEQPKNPNILYFLAYLNSEMGRLDEAIDCYKRLHEVQPKNDRAWKNLGLLYDQQGKLDLAIEALNKALELNPNNGNTHFNIAVAYNQQGKSAKAEEHLKRAIPLLPSPANAYNNLGTLYAAEGRHNEAVEAFKNAIAVDPSFGLAHKNCARCYLQLKKPKKASRHLNRAVQLGVQVEPELEKAIRGGLK